MEVKTMPEVKNYLKIEDQINHELSGDVQKNALDFVAFLRTNDLSPESNEQHDGWNIFCREKIIVFSKVIGDENVFAIVLNNCNFDGDLADDDLREFAWARVVFCPKGCGGTTICKMSQKRRTIFGKDFEHICVAPYEFFNLDADELKKAQKLILMLK